MSEDAFEKIGDGFGVGKKGCIKIQVFADISKGEYLFLNPNRNGTYRLKRKIKSKPAIEPPSKEKVSPAPSNNANRAMPVPGKSPLLRAQAPYSKRLSANQTAAFFS